MNDGRHDRDSCAAAGCGKKEMQRIMVVQQDQKAERKIEGIREYGKGAFQLDVVSITSDLPPVIDDGCPYLPQEISADLVLDYLTHLDLSEDLVGICEEKRIPVVASGKKISNRWAYIPPICCALPRRSALGLYGEHFGAPVFEVMIDEGMIKNIEVIRGAPCGATWKAVEKVVGLEVCEAVVRLGLETQFFCSADPAGWDPIMEKSPVHFAGALHARALARAVKKIAPDYKNKLEELL